MQAARAQVSVTSAAFQTSTRTLVLKLRLSCFSSSFLPVPWFASLLLLSRPILLCPPGRTNLANSFKSGMTCEPHLAFISQFHRLLKRMHLSAHHTRYTTPPPCCTSQVNDALSLQYHAIATGTILFYDYLLTLEDEVRLEFVSRASYFRTESAL